MKISSIPKKEYDELYAEYSRQEFAVNTSPNGIYRLKTHYQGEFPHGDAYQYCEVIEQSTGISVWSYLDGDPIRDNGCKDTCWSLDSKNLYFSLINNGNQIIKFDAENGKNKTLFVGDDAKGLCWLRFVSPSFNGVIFNSTTYNSNDKEFDTSYYVYVEKIDKTINLNHFFTGNFSVIPSSIENCINVLNEGVIYTFDVTLEDILDSIFIPFSIENDKKLYLSILSDVTIAMNYIEGKERRFACISNY